MTTINTTSLMMWLRKQFYHILPITFLDKKNTTSESIETKLGGSYHALREFVS